MIDTGALRSKIIDLAIQGKLTEQLPTDGNAEDLYQQIQAEMAQLIKDKKIKKIKPLPEISADEIPFEIPDNWKWVRLGEVIKLQSGQDLPKSSYNDVDNGVPYITGASNFVNEELLINRWTSVPTALATAGDVLLTCKGTVGKLSVLNINGYVHLARQIMGIRGYGQEPYYIKYFLEGMINRFVEASKGLIPGIERKDVLSVHYPLPPLSEQKRIVAKIEEVLAEIKIIDELQSQYASNVEVLKSKIIDAGIRGQLTEQLPEDGTAEELYQAIQMEKAQLIKDKKIKKEKPLPEITADEIPFDTPNGWKWCYINDIAFVTKLAGFEYSKYISHNLVDAGIPLFKGKNIQKGQLIEEFESYIPEEISNELFRSQLSKKCLLTPYVGTIGNIAIFEGNYIAHLGSNVGKIEVFNGDNIYLMEEYLLFYLRSSYGYKELTKYKKATAQESISIEAIRNVIIPLPTLSEQKRIVAKIDEVFGALDARDRL